MEPASSSTLSSLCSAIECSSVSLSRSSSGTRRCHRSVHPVSVRLSTPVFCAGPDQTVPVPQFMLSPVLSAHSQTAGTASCFFLQLSDLCPALAGFSCVEIVCSPRVGPCPSSRAHTTHVAGGASMCRHVTSCPPLSGELRDLASRRRFLRKRGSSPWRRELRLFPAPVAHDPKINSFHLSVGALTMFSLPFSDSLG